MEDALVIGGRGMIGGATMKALNIPYCFDIKDSNISLKEGAKKLFCFICLPTPTDGRGLQQGIDEIRAIIQAVREFGGRNIFVIRSTVIPGTCRNLAETLDVMVVSNPEFLTERTWRKDVMKPEMIVIGADDVPTRNAVLGIYKRFKLSRKVVTDTVTAETLKYAFNTFYATKVVWANQLLDICQINGAKYKDIQRALHRHPWGSGNHLRAIHNRGRGAGGRCLPKDLEAFAKYANSDLLKEVQRLNRKYLQKSKKK
jgi:UDPglucose 6-dehydrogenase